MKRTTSIALALGALAVVALSPGARDAAAQGSPAAPAAPTGDAPPDAQSILDNLAVPAGATRPLPKIAVLPSLASAMEDVTIRSVVRRDLDLSGEFEVLPDSAAPDGLYLEDSPVDVKAWAAKGAEAVVKVSGKKTGPDKAELRGQAYFVNVGEQPVFDKRFEVPLDDVRFESHRIADLIIGALTGQNGGFASKMVFVSGSGTLRRAFMIDADGHDAKPVSPPDQIALAPAFGPGQEVWWTGSANKDIYRLYKQSAPTTPIDTNVDGSVYGLAFAGDKSKVALAVGVGPTIRIFEGPTLEQLKPASPIGMALRPAYSSTGKLAFAGEGKYGQRIYVDGKAVSPDGLFASSPTFCRNPDGVRVVYAVGVGKNLDLVATGETGGGTYRLTQNQGSNAYPACSPDGRLVAFFSTRKSGEGPGLYIMRLDGGRPKRVSTLLGDSLRWEALPPGRAREITAPRAAAPAPPAAPPTSAAPAATPAKPPPPPTAAPPRPAPPAPPPKRR
jgi:TolB protein